MISQSAKRKVPLDVALIKRSPPLVGGDKREGALGAEEEEDKL
jgi:hypothetical protein